MYACVDLPILYPHTHNPTHMHMYACVCVCVNVCVRLSERERERMVENICTHEYIYFTLHNT